MPSLELTHYLRLRGAGVPVEQASAQSTIPLTEAWLHEKSVEDGELAFITEEKNMEIAADQLRLYIERIERLEEEKRALADDIKDVYAEAKSNGFDKWAMREVVKLRKLEPHVRQERDALLDCYRDAVGLTPIEAAIRDLAKGGVTSIQVGDDEPIRLQPAA